MARAVRRLGIDLDTADDATRRMVEARYTLGDPDEVGEKLSAVLDLGIDGFTCNLPANGHDADNVELLGRTVAELLT